MLLLSLLFGKVKQREQNIEVVNAKVEVMMKIYFGISCHLVSASFTGEKIT